MLKYLCGLLFLAARCLILAVGSFTTLPTAIDSPDYTAGVFYNVFCCFSSVNNQIVFSWSDSVYQHPSYCIYDANTGAFSTLPIQIDPAGYTAGVKNNVFCCFSSVNNQVFFSWADNNSKPRYCIYDVSTSTFSTLPTQIDPTGYTAGVIGDVFCCFSSANNQVFFSWTDLSNNPWYCIYDVSTSTFSTLPTQIDPTGYTAGVIGDLFCCFSSANNRVVFSWLDNTSYEPWYCIYDVSTSTFSTLPTQIDPTGYTAGGYFNVFCCYNNVNNQVFFSWSDNTSQNPWYCIYDVSTSTFSTLPTQIDPTSYTAGVYYGVFCCFSSANNQVFFSWADDNSQNPWYCIYDVRTSSFSTLPTQIDPAGYTAGVASSLFCCYNSANNQVFFSWSDLFSPYNPWYAIYTEPNASSLQQAFAKYCPLKLIKGVH